MRDEARQEPKCKGWRSAVDSLLGSRWVWGSPLFALAVAALSYVRASDPTTNDFERFADLRLTFAFFGVFLLWVGWYARLVFYAPCRAIGTAREFWCVFVGTGIPLLVSFPVGSRDVFAYAFYGRMWAEYGLEPAVTPPVELQHDAWFPLLQAWWKEGAAGYGPLFLLQTRVIGLLSDDSWWLAVVLFKLTNFLLLSFALALELKRDGGRSRGYEAEFHKGGAPTRMEAVLLALNPLLLFESLSSAHNDCAMAIVLLAALRQWQRHRPACAAVLWGCSFWYKWYSLAVLPVWLFWWWRRRGAAKFFLELGRSVLVFLLLSVVLLLPFGSAAWEVLRKPIAIEVGIRLMPTEFPPTLWILFAFFLASGVLPVQLGRVLFDVTRYAVLLVGLAVLLWRRRATPKQAELCERDLYISLLLFFSFVVTVLWPWHLLAPLLMALVIRQPGERALAVVLTALGMLSYFLTFSVATLALGLTAMVWWLGERRRSQRAAA